MIKASVVGATIVSFLILLSVDGLGSWFAGSKGGATIGNSSLAALYLIWNVFFSFIVVINVENKKKKALWVLGTLVILLSPLFLNWHALLGWIDISNVIDLIGVARAAILSIVLGILISVAVWLLFKTAKFKIMGLCLFLVIAVGLGFTAIKIGDPDSGIRSQFKQSDGENRLIFWDIAWKGVKENPVLGWGPSTYDILYHQKFDAKMLVTLYPETLVKNSHNIVLEILLNGGIILLLASVLLWVSLFYSLFQAQRSGQLTVAEFALLAGGFSAWLFQMLLAYNPLISAVMLYLLIGIGYGLASNPDAIKLTCKTHFLTAVKRNTLLGYIFIMIVFAWIAIYLPFKEARTLKNITEAKLPQRTAIWEHLGKNSPIVRGYDSVWLISYMYTDYYKQKSEIIKLDAKSKQTIDREFDAINKYLFTLLQSPNTHPQTALIASQMALLQMEIQQTPNSETVQHALRVSDLALVNAPSDPRSFIVAAQIHFAAKDINKSKELLEYAISLEPALPESYNVLLAIAAKVNDKQYYDKILNRAQEVIPNYQSRTNF